jgi:hypothetical protein
LRAKHGLELTKRKPGSYGKLEKIIGSSPVDIRHPYDSQIAILGTIPLAIKERDQIARLARCPRNTSLTHVTLCCSVYFLLFLWLI